MSDMKNIYDVLDEIGFENQCEKYALGFHRDTDTPTMTKFRQESIKQFCFSLIQQYAEKAYEDFIRTRKALDIAVKRLGYIKNNYKSWTPDRDVQMIAQAVNGLDEIKTALEQKE